MAVSLRTDASPPFIHTLAVVIGCFLNQWVVVHLPVSVIVCGVWRWKSVICAILSCFRGALFCLSRPVWTCTGLVSTGTAAALKIFFWSWDDSRSVFSFIEISVLWNTPDQSYCCFKLGFQHSHWRLIFHTLVAHTKWVVVLKEA